MKTGNELDFLNMICDYEHLGFDALWAEFLKHYPKSKFPENYARVRFNDMMNEGLEAQE